MSDDRPTDDELQAMGDLGVHLKNLRAAAAMLAGTPAHGAVLETIDALVGEIRRLRSDEWLERVARELMTTWPPGTTTVYRDQAAYDDARDGLIAVLRKHRDGGV